MADGRALVKFCGLTRAEDARVAAALGAAYVGVIFAGGPRRLAPEVATAVLDGARDVGTARRVGVFGDAPVAEIAEIAQRVSLDVVQLHGDASTARVDALRQRYGGHIWRVLRVRAAPTAEALSAAADGVDALVIDALVDGALGGTGVAVDWESLATALDLAGRPAMLVLAGGLRPTNVEAAIRLVAPDVVDVSSGVESAVGIKDHAMMRAFVDSARGGQ